MIERTSARFLLILDNVENEAAIDLHDIDGQTAEIAQRGISCAEIIEGEFDADAFQVPKDFDGVALVPKQGTLCDFDFDVTGRQV